MPITSFTVGGVEIDTGPLLEGFEIRETTGDVSTLTCDLESVGSPVQRFSLHQTTIVKEDGVRIFGGNNTQTHERGFGGPNLYDAVSGAPQIVTTITAEDYYRLPQRVYFTGTIADGTPLKDAMTAVLAGDLGTLGVTLDPAQVTGPTLPLLTFTRTLVADVAKAFSDATGYLSRIDYDKTWRMWAPGDIAAPFDIDETDDPPKWTDDVEVENILGDDYANRVIVTGALITQYGRVEQFTGDGTTTTFTLEYTPFANRGYVVGDYSTNLFETLRTPSDPDAATWTLDGQTLTRTSPPPVGADIRIEFDGTFTPFATAEDAPSIADPDIGLYAFEFDASNSGVTDTASAQALADQLLAQKLTSGSQTIVFKTRYPAPTLRAGQQMTINAPARNLSGTYIITDMVVQAEAPATDDFAPDMGLIRTLTARKSNPLAGKFQQTYKDWLEGGAGGGTAAPSSGTAAAVGPAPPDGAVQYNDTGKFGGKPEFKFYKIQNSMHMGRDCSITAAQFESCLALGFDCHVSDPS